MSQHHPSLPVGTTTVTPPLPEDTRERLIHVAKTQFAEKGFDGTTVKELAHAAGVNISLISYHFGGKEGLYRACLEQFGKMRLAVAERVLQPPTSIEALEFRLKMFVEEFLTCHLEQPELTQILHRECDMQVPLAKDIFEKTFFKVFETLVEFLRASKERNLLRQSMDPFITSGLFFGSLVHLVRSEKMNRSMLGITLADPLLREKIIEQSINNLLMGCIDPSKRGVEP